MTDCIRTHGRTDAVLSLEIDERKKKEKQITEFYA
jgi:hypothetical protein